MNKNQLMLPFAEREYVDMPRACRILGASWNMVVGMAAGGYLRLVDYRRNSHKRVHYGTLVEHCNRLREEYAIPDRRPPLACELLRHRDDDILPFPLRDTIAVADDPEALRARLYPQFDWGKVADWNEQIHVSSGAPILEAKTPKARKKEAAA
jgi:hypothetical protein